MVQAKYKTKPLECWQEAKQIRMDYYRDYAAAKEKGGLRWAGGAFAFDAVVAGLGDDVYSITSEPYGASIAGDPTFSLHCQEAIEKRGYARDLCAYMRNYWGSIVLDRYLWGGPWPKADFLWQDHLCCSHAKWYQVIAHDLEPGTPFYCVDLSVGAYDELTESRIQYVASQFLDGIEWLQKVTGRKYDDEKFIQAVHNHCRSTALWSEICTYTQNIPTPLDEKTMYSLYVLATLHKSSLRVANFYERLRDEVKQRAADGIAASANEQCRVITDSQPPWAFLWIWRYMEKYGVVSVGSAYTFTLIGAWDVAEDGTLSPPKTPQEKGIVLKNREQAMKTLVEWELRKPCYAGFYNIKYKSQLAIQIAKQWKADGAIFHLNRGCEGAALYQMEVRKALADTGIPVVTYEGNMGDARECNEATTKRRLDIFFRDTLGLTFQD